MSLLLVLGGSAPAGVSADWNSSEGADNAAFSVSLGVSAAWASLEAGDNAAFVAQLRVDAAWSSVEGADSALFAGSVTATAAWASVESGDSAAFAGNVGAGDVQAVWDAQEGGDSGAFYCEVAQPEQQPFFPRGGGPFTRKYGYYGYHTEQEDSEDDIESSQQVRQALDRTSIEKVEAQVERAASAIRKGDAEPVLDAERIYAETINRVRSRVNAEVAGILAKERVDAYWRAEVRRRLQERDDEETVLMIAELL